MAIASMVLMSAVTVSDLSGLNAAVQRAKGGDEIILAPGDYGMVQFVNAAFDKPVTIRSQDPRHPARFARLRMLNPRNIIFSDIEITRVRGAEPEWAKLAEITGGSDVTIRGGSVHGSLNGSPRDDLSGIFARKTTRFRVSGVTFKELSVALIIEDSNDFTVERSNFSYLGVDSMEIPVANGAHIIGNRFSDYRPNPGAHPDAIQCWTVRKPAGCHDVLISHNVFQGAPGYEFQGVFFGDEAKVGGFDRIEISDNIFSGLMWHAIYIGGAGEGIKITNNTIQAGPTMRSWIRTVGPAQLSGNVAPTYAIAGGNTVPRGNRRGGAFKR